MQLTVIAGFGMGDIDTHEVAPTVLKIVVDLERGRAMDDLLAISLGGPEPPFAAVASPLSRVCPLPVGFIPSRRDLFLWHPIPSSAVDCPGNR